MHNHNPQHVHCKHTNAFVDLNGLPYLAAEYLDTRNFQQIDRSAIRSEIYIDQSEAMRAIVDISVDDIGKRASDGMPAAIGNNTKQRKLLEMIKTNAGATDHQLNVVKRGIVLRVNYHLENQTTGQVIRSMTEDIPIINRSYFLNINQADLNDNSIIVNFSDSVVSTINEFTHGTDKMVIRITNLQMFYECLQKNHVVPRLQQNLGSNYYGDRLPSTFGSESEMYKYHQQMQNRHMFCDDGDYGYGSYGFEGPSMINPPTWTGFNRYYHFDEGGHSIILHDQEIRFPGVKVLMIAAGQVNINRAFMINPGHRIIFKFSIWKNDLTVVNDTLPIAQALDAYIQPVCPDHGCDDHCHNHPIQPDYETLIRIYKDLQVMNDRQNSVMNAMMNRMDLMSDQIASLLPPVVDPEPPVEPEEPTDPVDPPTETDPETPVDPPSGV